MEIQINALHAIKIIIVLKNFKKILLENVYARKDIMKKIKKMFVNYVQYFGF